VLAVTIHDTLMFGLVCTES